jgi:hypothetical protein
MPVTTPVVSALKNYSRSPNEYSKPLLDPGGRLISETATQATVSEAKRLDIYSGYI